MIPQFLPCAEQVEGEQPLPQTLGPPPPQVSPAGQAPQLSALPQPSPVIPQFLPCAEQVEGEQPLPQTSGPPPPQVSPAGQVPQLRVPLQSLEMIPQFAPCAAQVVGAQPVVVVVLEVVVVVVVLGGLVVVVLVGARISGAHTIFGVLGATRRFPNWSCHCICGSVAFGHLTL
jgi:hypothetical protein